MKEVIFGKKRFCRDDIPESARIIENWPTVDASALSEKHREIFNARCDAIRQFLSDVIVPVSSISENTGVQPKTIYRVVGQCLARHADGRINGFRGAIPYARFKPYERTVPVRASFDGNGGASGAFEMLLNKYPTIRRMLNRYAVERAKKIKAGGVFNRSSHDIHQTFMKDCRKLGVKPTEYPFTEKRVGFRSLQNFFKKVADEEFARAVRHAGGLKANSVVTNIPQAPAATRAFEVAQFDGHKIDLRLTVRMIDPHGFERLLEINRVWILVLLDVYTRAAIGYALTLSKEYNKDDIAEALQASLVPFKARSYKIPNLAIRDGGGFPSSVVPKTAYACWDWFAIDGAKAHLAADTLVRLNQIVGCWTDNGPPGEPNARPYIERFFHLISRHFAHKLPGSLGNDPDSIERALCDPGGDLRLLMEYQELEELIEVVIANYNGSPHSGVGDRTPLEAMALSVECQGYLRALPRQLRSSLCMLQEARIKTVKGSAKKGVRPHINFSNVKYTSDILSDNAALIEKKLRIYYDVRDVRTVKAYFEDGSELGILRAARPWCFTPHSLRVRQEIFRLLAEKKLKIHDGEDPIQVWAQYKWKQVKTSKKAANDLAKAQQNGTWTVTKVPGSSASSPKPQIENTALHDVSTPPPKSNSSLAGEPIKGKILNIRRVLKF